MMIGIGVGVGFQQGVGSFVQIPETPPSNIIVSDTFNREDSTTALGNADTGQVWTVVAGTWGIIANQVYNAGNTTNAIATVDTGYSNCTVSVKFATVNTNMKVMFRVNNSNSFLHIERAPSSYDLWRNNAGAWTKLATHPSSATNGDAINVNLNGNEITAYLNGSLMYTITEAFNATVTKHGIGANSSGVRFDDFLVESL